MQKEVEKSENRVLDNFIKKRKLKIFYLMGIFIVLIILTLVLVFLFINYFKTPEKQLSLGADIENVLISEDGKIAYVKLSGGSNAENITGVKFVLKDSNGEEYIYETDEGIDNISVSYNKGFWNNLFGKKFNGIYNYEINANKVGLNSFSNVNEIKVIFKYQEQDEEIEIPVLDTKKPIVGGGAGGSGGGGGGDSGGGSPVPIVECVDNDDCESLNLLGDNYCFDGNVYRDSYNPSCSDSICNKDIDKIIINKILIQGCGSSCENGVCDGNIEFLNNHNFNDEILVLYNENDLDSKDIAEYYASKRNIDSSHLCGIRLSTGDYGDYSHVLGAREKIIENCICSLIDDNVKPVPCDSSNLDEIIKYSKITHLAIMKGIPQRLSNAPFYEGTSEPSLDFYLSKMIYQVLPDLEGYFPDYSKSPYYFNAINFNTNLVREINVENDRVLAYSRIEAMNKQRTFDLIDRTILAEKHGVFGNFISGQKGFSSGYLYFNNLTNNDCGYKENGDYDGCRVWLGQGEIPGEVGRSNIARVNNAVVFFNTYYLTNTMKAFDYFSNMLNWRKTNEDCEPLCRNTANPDACRLTSTDYFKEINTDCVGVAEGFLGFQLRSYPVQYFGFWPKGWYSYEAGEVEKTPPIVLEGNSFINEEFTDNKFLRFGQNNDVENSYCFLNDGSSEPCSEKVIPNLYKDIYVNNRAANDDYSFKFRIKYPPQEANSKIIVKIYARDYENKEWHILEDSNLMLDNEGEDWATKEYALNINPDNFEYGNYDYVQVSLRGELNNPIEDWIDFDGIELTRLSDSAELISINEGSFNNGFESTNNGDWASNVIDRLGGIAWWGSSSHFQTGGNAFYVPDHFARSFYGGRGFGESIMFMGGASAVSGIVYGDPLYRPMGVKIYYGDGVRQGTHLPFAKPEDSYYQLNDESIEVSINAFNGLDNINSVYWSLFYCNLENAGECDNSDSWINIHNENGAVLKKDVPIDLTRFSSENPVDSSFILKLTISTDKESVEDNYYDYVYFRNSYGLIEADSDDNDKGLGSLGFFGKIYDFLKKMFGFN